jgi:hypothetical protein
MAASGVTAAALSSDLSARRFFVFRERQVMLDEDLADLYCVETKRLVDATLTSFRAATKCHRPRAVVIADRRGRLGRVEDAV